MSNMVQLKLFTLEEAEKHIPKYCPTCGTPKGWFVLNHFMTTDGRWYLEYRCINCGRRNTFRCSDPEKVKK